MSRWRAEMVLPLGGGDGGDGLLRCLGEQLQEGFHGGVPNP